jgi:hypothetical protein
VLQAWTSLDAEEQALVSMVIDSWLAGEFVSDDAWLRYELVTFDLLPHLQAGKITAADAHAAGMAAANQLPWPSASGPPFDVTE